MKRVLFYYDNFCGETSKGGTEVATYRIAKALKEFGKDIEVYQVFRRKCDPINKFPYTDIARLSNYYPTFEKELADFISKYEIDYVINMSRFFRHEAIAKAAKKSGRDVKVMFMQHFAPGSEIKKPTFKSGIHLLRLNPLNPLYWLRASVYPLIKFPRNLKYKKVYREVYEKSSKVILLSKGYEEDYCKTGGFADKSKFVAIPNIFDNSETSSGKEILAGKKKRVLILSRLDEIQKRISLALKIWQKIEQDQDLTDWSLDIVGTGHDAGIVKKLVRQLGLNRVILHGWQERKSFLKEDSILMMTSEYEGLPLSILEAQAFGCVPIAFDSFASLKDIVTPFENGVIVERFGDIDDFTTKLKDLMNDRDYREELAKNCMKASDAFSSGNIASLWLDILK